MYDTGYSNEVLRSNGESVSWFPRTARFRLMFLILQLTVVSCIRFEGKTGNINKCVHSLSEIIARYEERRRDNVTRVPQVRHRRMARVFVAMGILGNRGG